LALPIARETVNIRDGIAGTDGTTEDGLMPYATQSKKGDERNRLYEEDLPVHEWYQFVLCYPPHLVRHYADELCLSEGDRVLDPFCGTGTTLVECKKLGLPSVGIEANPVVAFAADVKTDWDVDPDSLEEYANDVAAAARKELKSQGIEDEPLLKLPIKDAPPYKTLDKEKQRLLIKDSISQRPLHKVLTLLEHMDRHPDERCRRYGRLALAKELVSSIGNLRFGPEVGVGKIKDDAPVVAAWRHAVASMAQDLRTVRHLDRAQAVVHEGDAREPGKHIEDCSVDAIITSPPYPNEKDYTRTTRLESVLLGFINTRKGLRRHKEQLVRSNTRGVYVADRDDEWIAEFPRVLELAHRIEQRRIELGKTSGFEKLYHRVVRLYFGGMARHLGALKHILRPGARLAYVVGDQASYFRIMVQTGGILANIAERLGYKVLGIDLFRTRFSTATKSELREEVVLLQWNP